MLPGAAAVPIPGTRGRMWRCSPLQVDVPVYAARPDRPTAVDRQVDRRRGLPFSVQLVGNRAGESWSHRFDDEVVIITHLGHHQPPVLAGGQVAVDPLLGRVAVSPDDLNGLEDVAVLVDHWTAQPGSVGAGPQDGGCVPSGRG